MCGRGSGGGSGVPACAATIRCVGRYTSRTVKHVAHTNYALSTSVGINGVTDLQFQTCHRCEPVSCVRCVNVQVNTYATVLARPTPGAQNDIPRKRASERDSRHNNWLIRPYIRKIRGMGSRGKLLKTKVGICKARSGCHLSWENPFCNCIAEKLQGAAGEREQIYLYHCCTDC